MLPIAHQAIYYNFDDLLPGSTGSATAIVHDYSQGRCRMELHVTRLGDERRLWSDDSSDPTKFTFTSFDDHVPEVLWKTLFLLFRQCKTLAGRLSTSCRIWLFNCLSEASMWPNGSTWLTDIQVALNSRCRFYLAESNGYVRFKNNRLLGAGPFAVLGHKSKLPRVGDLLLKLMAGSGQEAVFYFVEVKPTLFGFFTGQVRNDGSTRDYNYSQSPGCTLSDDEVKAIFDAV